MSECGEYYFHTNYDFLTAKFNSTLLDKNFAEVRPDELDIDNLCVYLEKIFSIKEWFADKLDKFPVENNAALMAAFKNQTHHDVDELNALLDERNRLEDMAMEVAKHGKKA